MIFMVTHFCHHYETSWRVPFDFNNQNLRRLGEQLTWEFMFYCSLKGCLAIHARPRRPCRPPTPRKTATEAYLHMKAQIIFSDLWFRSPAPPNELRGQIIKRYFTSWQRIEALSGRNEYTQNRIQTWWNINTADLLFMTCQSLKRRPSRVRPHLRMQKQIHLWSTCK